MLNKVILIGRLTRDPELRYTANSNIPVARFTLAVNRRFQPGEVDYTDVVCWRQLAETCAQHLGKGRMAAVSGSLQIRSYETQGGQKRKAAEVVADEVRFLDSSKQSTQVHDSDLTSQWDGAEESDLPF